MLEMERYQGIVVPIPSPAGPDGALDLDALGRLAETLTEAPIRGMYLCGGTGDGEKLLPEERRAVVETLAPFLKRTDRLTIVHVGQCNLRTGLALAEHAAAAGADAIAAIPPRAPWESVRAYYAALAKAGLPVFVYYIPGVTGMQAGLAEIASLLSVDGVAGLKVSDWNVFLIRQIRLAHPEAIVYTGYDEMLLPGLLYGAQGSIGTWANLFPWLYCKLYDHAARGEWTQAQALSEPFAAFLAEGWRTGILPMFEAVMRHKGVPCCFRSPLGWAHKDLAQAEIERLAQRAEQLEALARSL